MGVFTEQEHERCAAHLVMKEGHHEIHAVSICRVGKAYTKDHGKARHLRLRGGGCRNRLLHMVALRHNYIIQRVAEVRA